MNTNEPNAYDLCVIGCGPGGFAAAMRALDLGKKVCVIEGGQIGGAGVMWGALASKTMWELAKDYAVAAKINRGYRSSGLLVDYKAVRNTVVQAIKEKQYQMLSQLETFSPRRWDGPGAITFIRGRGTFLSRHRLNILGRDGSQMGVTAKFVLIATGSRPKPFPGTQIDQKRIINSNGVLGLRKFPRRMMIVGAGITGCEYATIFSNFGQTKVFLVDHMERVIPFEDEDVSDFVDNSLRKNGVEIFHSAHLRDIIRHRNYLEVVLDFDDNHSEVVEVDTVFISVGRTPNLTTLKLEKAGLKTTARGYLETNDNCCVKDNIYAAGDVTQHPNLVNVAEMEGRFAVKHMFGVSQRPLNYSNMSTIMFFYPEVAAVGLNEKKCQEMKIPYLAAHYSNSLLNRAIAMRNTDGFVKIIASDDEDQRILGMRAAGAQVSGTIMSIALMMEQDKKMGDVLKSLYPHPTMSEAIQEGMRLLLNKSVYKCQAFPNHLKIWSWHPEKGFEMGPKPMACGI